MAFNSSLLKATDSGSTGIELQSVVSNIDTRPPIYNYLEFNSDIQDIDLGSKIAQYRLLVEGVYLEDNNQSLTVVNEGLIKNIFDGLVNIIKKVIDFVRRVGKKILSKLGFSFKDPVKVDAERSDDIWSKKLTVKVFHYPRILDIDAGGYRACLRNLITRIDRLSNGEDTTEATDKDTATAFKALYKMVKKCATPGSPVYSGKVDSPSTFAEFIKTEICYVTEKDVIFKNYYDETLARVTYMIRNQNAIRAKVSELANLMDADLNKAKSILENASNKPDKYTQEQVDKIRSTVMRIQQVCVAYENFITTVVTYFYNESAYTKDIINRVAKARNGNSYSESALFHGEPFNSDTLFDNEDMRDFNRTEWIDLNLTVECYEMKYALTKSMQDLIVNEALILTDDKPNKIVRLKALREAEEKKSGGKIATLVDNIRKILQKFISALTPKFNNLAGYIRKYKGQIDKPIAFTSNMKSNGDVLAGMYRVQSAINIIPFDYNAMKDDLKDKKTFFTKRILPSMNKTVQSSKRNVKWTDDMEVATYCKIYFGASMPQDKYPMCEFTASEMDSNKGNIIRYLTEKNMAFSAKTDLAKLEAESKKINVSAAAKAATKATSDNKDTNNSTSNATATPASDNNSKNESMYYSELYQRWITEADIDMGNVAQNAGDTGSANADNEIFKAFRVYMDTYKDVIFAKMTGAEFVFSELKQLIVMHAVKNGAPKPGPDPVQPQGPAAKN